MGLRIEDFTVPDDLIGGASRLDAPMGGGLYPSGRSPLDAPGLTVAQASEERARRKNKEDQIRQQLEAEQAETFLGKLGRTFGGPGYAVMNLMRGRPGAAVKNLADTALGVVTLDPITGLGSRFASREEQPTASEVLEDWGADAPKGGFARFGVDLAGGLLTDPLTYMTLGGSTTARAIAMAKNVKKLEKMPNWAGDLSTALSTTKAGRMRWQGALDEASKVRPTFVGTPSGKVKIAKGADIEEEAARIVMKKMGQSADPEGYIATLKGLEDTGDILKAGLRYDPWLIRAPLRGMGLIKEGVMEPRLLSGLGGALDETLANRGFWAGPSGKVLENLTAPGWLYKAAGKWAPQAQEAMRMPFDATIRKLFNPTHGKLRGIAKGDRGLLYLLEDAARATKEAQFRNSQDFTALLTRAFEGLDEQTTKELREVLEESFGMKEMDKIIDEAYGNLGYGSRVSAPSAPTTFAREAAEGVAPKTEVLSDAPWMLTREEFEATGTPLMHGTSREFDLFGVAYDRWGRRKKITDRYGRDIRSELDRFYFTDKPGVAQTFADSGGFRQVDLDRLYGGTEVWLVTGETFPQISDDLFKSLNKQLSDGKILAYVDYSGDLVKVTDPRKIPLDVYLDGDVRLYEPGRWPRVIKTKVYGKTLDLTDPNNIPESLRKVLEKEGSFKPWETGLPGFQHEFSPELIKWARENNYGKIVVKDASESGFKSTIALQEYIGHGRGRGSGVYETPHLQLVKEALSKGYPVPKRVLDDYPAHQLREAAERGAEVRKAAKPKPKPKAPKKTPEEPLREREGLFFARETAEELGEGNLERGYEMMYDNLQEEVNRLLVGKFGGIAESVVNSRKGAAGWTADQAEQFKKKLYNLQSWVHKHHQKMLKEAQEDRKLMTTSTVVEDYRKVDPMVDPVSMLFPLSSTPPVLEEVGRRIGRIGLNFYMPTQMSTEFSELLSRSAGKLKGKPEAMAASIKTAYENFRKHPNVEKFREAIIEIGERAGIDASKLKVDPVKEDLFDLILRRYAAHNRAMTNKGFIDKAAQIVGRKPTEGSLRAMGKTLDDVRLAEFELEKLQNKLDSQTDLPPEAIKELEKAIDEQAQVLREVGGFTKEDLKSIRNIGQVEWPVEGAQAFVRQALTGIGRRGDIGRQWDSVNHWLKQSMTVGIGNVPFLAFSSRNLMGGMVQALMDPSTSAADAMRPMLALMHDFPLTRWMTAPFKTVEAEQVNLFRKALESVELRSPWVETFDDAYVRLLKAKDPSALALETLEKSGVKIAGLSPKEILQEISENGIVGKDYAATELFKRQIQNPETLKQVRKSLMGSGDEPARNLPREIILAMKTNSLPRRIASSVEDTMRLNSYLSMRRKGISPTRASERVNRLHVDYKFTSEFDRNMRSIFPFFAFRKGTLPVVMEQAITRPSTVTPLLKGMHSLKGDEEEMVPPWLSGKTALPVGMDKEGRMMFLTSFGLIHEDVDTLLSGFGDVKAALTGKSGFGEGAKRGITPGEWTRVAVGSAMHPWLKGILQYATEKDFYFGTELGDYRKAPSWMTSPLFPGMEEALTATGLLKKETSKAGKDYYKVPRWFHPVMGVTPLNRLSGEIDRVLDQNKEWWQSVLMGSTGVKIVNVDQERELKRRLGDWLKDQVRAGDIAKMEVFFGRGELPPEAAEMLNYYNELMRGKKPKKKPVKPGPGIGPPDSVSNRSAFAPQAQPRGLGFGLSRPIFPSER